ncbi:GTPase Era [Pseudanabaena sp. SR411]|uniref:GTPase Era n=1 Tax=Pseudanabaena sp. SR411 TaxID=1980935 RepID=UPI001594FDB1|nr:GTPase Era [Pseudanabaena sp. SR411]
MIPESGEGFKSGFVALVGRPNVGKSTLLNALIGQKIAITSPVAQTTRNRLRGILTLPEAQIVLVDTPGIHKPHHLLGQTIVKNAIGAISSVDMTVLLVDGSDRMGTGDRFVAETILQSNVPTILGINKIDILNDDSGDTFTGYESFAEEHGWQVAKFSSVTGEGLEALQTMMCERLPLGPYYYPPDLVTDQPERFIMGELIREQILLLTREEIPHSVAISIDQVDEQPKITRVMATIHVERDSQKGILIGKKGQMLKEIGTQARLQMQKMIMGSVHLEMFVKVQPKWRSSRFQLSDLGYRVE